MYRKHISKTSKFFIKASPTDHEEQPVLQIQASQRLGAIEVLSQEVHPVESCADPSDLQRDHYGHSEQPEVDQTDPPQAHDE